MSRVDQTYRVVTQGIKPGADLDTVAHKVEALFKCSRADIEPLLAAKRSVVKKKLSETSAAKYMTALGNCGLLATMESETAATASAAPASVAAPKAAEPVAPNAADQAKVAALTQQMALAAIAEKEEAARRATKVKAVAGVIAVAILLWMLSYLL